MTQGIILGNKILDVVFIAWFLAQAIKVGTFIIMNRKISFSKFIEAGGMPSSHSSSVVSLAVALWIKEGTTSMVFAVSCVFAAIVMYDAAGVRRAAGKQAETLNKIATTINEKEGDRLFDDDLKEILGHTPFEVIAGAVLGIVLAVLMRGYILG